MIDWDAASNLPWGMGSTNWEPKDQPIEELVDAVAPESPGDAQVWHYTGVAGALGILQSNSLRATRVTMLNDSAEIVHGLAVIEREWSEQGHHYEPNVRKQIDVIIQTMLPSTAGVSESFVVCASLDGASLSQYRLYGEYALGIDPTIRLSHDGRVADRYQGDNLDALGWRRVAYTAADKRKLTKRLFDTYASMIEEWPPDEVHVNQASKVPILWAIALAFMKEEAFRDENEVRAYGSTGTRTFRATSNGITSSIDLLPVGGQRLVKAARVGPGSADRARVETGLNELLLHEGYEFTAERAEMSFRP